MSNKLVSSIAETNPFRGLTSQQIDLYFILKSAFEKHWEGTPKEAGNPTFTNEQLASLARCHPTTVSRNLKALHEKNIIDFEYLPTKYGTLRFVIWKGLPNE